MTAKFLRLFNKKISENDIIKMVEIWLKTFSFGGHAGISICTECAPLLADPFLYSYESDLGLLKKGKKKAARSFRFTFHCIDVLFT
jgi:hypothetical protein